MRNTAESSIICYNGELIVMLLKYYFHYPVFQKRNEKRYSTVLLYFANTFRNLKVSKLRCLRSKFHSLLQVLFSKQNIHLIHNRHNRQTFKFGRREWRFENNNPKFFMDLECGTSIMRTQSLTQKIPIFLEHSKKLQSEVCTHLSFSHVHILLKITPCSDGQRYNFHS